MDNRFDENKMGYNQKPSENLTNFYIYKDSKKHTDLFTKEGEHKKNSAKACFSQLNNLLLEFSDTYKKWPDRLLFQCNFKLHSLQKLHVSYEEICWWCTICREHKLLPEYIGDEFAKTGKFRLIIDILDLRTLYIYLSMARYLQEEPYFVRAIKYLVCDKGINFYIAFAVASRCCICNSGHHVIRTHKKYPHFEPHNDPNTIDTYNISDVIKLKGFLDGEKCIDKIPIKDFKFGAPISPVNLHNTLDKIQTEKALVKHDDLTSKSIVEQFFKL